jgi:acetyltransferase-like isoleucine patch superfamily enzyme
VILPLNLKPVPSSFLDGHVEVGRFSYAVGGLCVVSVPPHGSVTIGNYCSIAEGVKFLAGVDHRLDLISTFPFTDAHHITKGPIIVGSDVWIGMDATILSGVTIGSGVAIGAGAVVTKDVPPYAVVAGVPAKVIRLRFTPVQIERLLEIAWWNWPNEKVEANAGLLGSPDIEKLLGTCKLAAARCAETS